MIYQPGALIGSMYPPRCKTFNQLIIKQIIAIIVMIMPLSVIANIPCHGRFVNPVTDICWSCLLPITIGGVKIGKGGSPKRRDIKGPSSPLCACSKLGSPVPIPGISIGFFEPVRMVEVTRSPYCMVNIGGISLGSDAKKMGYNASGYARRSTKSSFYHLHYYTYPLIYWLELLTDFACLEAGSFDVAYMSEFDVTWNDPKMQSLLNPEAILFGNPIAQSACSIDCASATMSTANDSLFWCAGCYGNMYPFSGANRDFEGGIQNSSLLTSRILAKMHRIGLGEETSTTDSSINGKLCRKSKALKIKKSQYKLQLVNPRSTSSGIGCWPLGMSDLAYSAGNEYPYSGQDFGYLIWRKRNCCLF